MKTLRFRKWNSGAFSAVIADPIADQYLIIEGDGRSRARVVRVDGDAFVEATSRPSEGTGSSLVTVASRSQKAGIKRIARRTFASGKVRLDEDQFSETGELSRRSQWMTRTGTTYASSELTGDTNVTTLFRNGEAHRRRTTSIKALSSNGLVVETLVADGAGNLISTIKRDLGGTPRRYSYSFVDQQEKIVGERTVYLSSAGFVTGVTTSKAAGFSNLHRWGNALVGGREFEWDDPNDGAHHKKTITWQNGGERTEVHTRSHNGEVRVETDHFTRSGGVVRGDHEVWVNGKLVTQGHSQTSDNGDFGGTTITDNGDGTYTVHTILKTGSRIQTSAHRYDENTDEEIGDGVETDTGNNDQNNNGSEEGGEGGGSSDDDDDPDPDGGESASDGGEDGYDDYGGRADEELGRILGLLVRYGDFSGRNNAGDGDGVGPQTYDAILRGLKLDGLRGGTGNGGRDDGSLGDHLGEPTVFIDSAYLRLLDGPAGHSEFDDPYNPKALVERLQESFGVASYAAVTDVAEAAIASQFG